MEDIVRRRSDSKRRQEVIRKCGHKQYQENMTKIRYEKAKAKYTNKDLESVIR